MNAADPPLSALATVPEPLRAAVARAWSDFVARAAATGQAIPGHADFLRSLARVWAVSQFVADACVAEPALLVDLLRSGDLLRDYRPRQYARQLRARLAGVADSAQLAVQLRRYRRREMVRIAWRDLAGWAPLAETLRDVSCLAEASIAAALEVLDAWQRAQWGTPRDAGGAPQSLIVLGMGKLGARELNFSSDVDLIFAYPEAGVTDGASSISNDQYFIALGRQLIEALGARTAEGFVFRVDMRLRPYGSSGPLAMSFAAMEEYYESQGRDWERYAMVKARVVAGDAQAGADLLNMLRPFVYRRYLDYGALAALRAMKTLIQTEVRRKGLADNIKLGAGGIREIEFIGQAFQLVRGGREPELQVREILRVLARLGHDGVLPAAAVLDLAAAYCFLRRAENRLQAYADQQTHVLPAGAEARLRLAYAMGYEDWASFEAALLAHRHGVREYFEQLITMPPVAAAPGTPAAPGAPAELWLAGLDPERAQHILRELGFSRTDEALRLLAQLRGGHAYRSLTAQGRERVDQLMPLLLAAVGASGAADVCWPRIVGFVEAIARRSAYAALLVENPAALSQLVRLFAASPWIAELLTRQPVLLDELLDARSLYMLQDRAALESTLDHLLAAYGPDDLERQMEALRYFKQAQVLHAAAADVAGVLPLTKVSDALTEIAEVVLRKVEQLAWQQMTAQYGVPLQGPGSTEPARFGIVGYGKLGGIELSYGSDLDLVFLHDSAPDGQTQGPKVINNQVFFARLGRRIIHILTAYTGAGTLYEVDMRLRPSGASGLLVSDLEAFAEYQRSEAWTWEHQALVRARPVAGAVAEPFQQVRREILCRRRDPAELRSAVMDMRERVVAQRAERAPGVLDLKSGPGGMTDIEFMVQYGVLRWAHEYPELTRYTDNLRILDGLAAAGLVSRARAQFLCDAYLAIRQHVHQLTLQDQPALVHDGELMVLCTRVRKLWEDWWSD